MNTTDDALGWLPPLQPILWTLLAIVSGYNVADLASSMEFHEALVTPQRVMVIPKRSPVQEISRNWRRISEDYTFPSVEELGADAVALVINAYHSANAGPGETRNWIRKHVPGLSRANLRPDELRSHALRTLSALGASYPAPVDRFYYDEIRTTNRIPILYSMAASGMRHFAFVTNLVTKGTIHDQGHAIRALGELGRNAQSAVPLVLSTLEKHGAKRDEIWWSGSLVLARIGQDHALTVPALLGQLEHTNTAARKAATDTLVDLTNHLHQIRHEFVRLARVPITPTNDPGEFVSHQLERLRVPPEIGVPILMKRLRHAIKLDGLAPDFNSPTCRWLSTISTYGTNAAPAIDLIEEKLLSHLSPPPDPNRFQPPVGSGLWRIQQSLRRVDPKWRLNFPTNSPP